MPRPTTAPARDDLARKDLARDDLARNDPAQYEELAAHWWRPRGVFAMLHWLAAARGELVPPARRAGAVLVDVGCGGGLLAPHVAGKGYRHVGVDLSPSGTRIAREHGVTAVRGDALRLPLADACADVVCAGEILEHLTDLRQAVAEVCRVLRPGGLLVIDTLADTRAARVVAIHIGERVPRMAPRGIHDPALLVDRDVLRAECARHGVRLALRGISPSVTDLLAWLAGRRDTVRMTTVPTTSILFQACGRKDSE